MCTKHDVKKHYVHLGVEPKIGGFYPPNHPFVHRVWNHYFHHPFWGVKSPYFWFNTFFQLGLEDGVEESEETSLIFESLKHGTSNPLSVANGC